MKTFLKDKDKEDIRKTLGVVLGFMKFSTTGLHERALGG